MKARNDQRNKEMTLDDLATIVQSSILELRSELKSDIKKLGTEIKAVKSDTENLATDLKAVKSDTENIKAEFNKKIDRFEHKELEFRVEKLEQKFA